MTKSWAKILNWGQFDFKFCLTTDTALLLILTVFSHMKNENNNSTYLIGLWELNEKISAKYLMYNNSINRSVSTKIWSLVNTFTASQDFSEKEAVESPLFVDRSLYFSMTRDVIFILTAFQSTMPSGNHGLLKGATEMFSL